MSQTKAQFIDGLNSSEFDNINVTGIITAASYSGDGSGLTGVANTAFINAEQVTVVGVVTATTFDGNLTGDVTGDVTGNLTGDVTGNLTGNVTGDVVGNITGVAATFSGNVSIGGTLTYEDVTNVDSIGVVTARTGVDVTTGGVDIAAGGLAVTGIATFNDNIVGDNSTNISGINSVTATAFYGDGSGLTGIAAGGDAGSSVVSSVNDGANGRLDTFGSGQFAVYTSSGTFDATGITSVRARVVGAGSRGCITQYTLTECLSGNCTGYSGGVFGCRCYYRQIPCISGTGGGAGGGYAHKVFESPEYPGPGVFNVQIGQPWNCNCTPTVGTSCFGSTLCATGGIGNVGGCGIGGDVNSTGGSPGFSITGGAAGSQLGPGNCANQPGLCYFCGNINNVPTSCERNNRRTHWGVERFPFDIFTGSTGLTGCLNTNTDGCSGGAGGSATIGVAYTSCAQAGCFYQNGACCSCFFPAPAVSAPDMVCLTQYTQTNQHFGGGCGGHGAGGGASTFSLCFPQGTGTYCSKPAGVGGYGGGGGSAISFCQKCTNNPTYAFSLTAPYNDAAAGGPGIVIIEW
jgi:hypothetical protein